MSASRRKGTEFETDVVNAFREWGFDVERRALSGKNDRGDIAGLPGWTLELKAEKAITLACYMDEAKTEARNAGTDLYAAVVKRRNRGTEQAYVVMPLKIFLKVLLTSADKGATMPTSEQKG